MKVVGHDHISNQLATILRQMTKPLIDAIIRLSFLEKRKPLVTSDGAKINLKGLIVNTVQGHGS